MGNPAYDYERFGARVLDEERVERRLRIVEKRKQEKQLKEQAAQNARNSLKIVIVSAILFTMVAAVMYCRVQLNEITAQQNKLKNQITVAESDNVRLNMELDAKASVYNIDEYAVDVLNMYKVAEQQINYLEPDFGNQLVLEKSE